MYLQIGRRLGADHVRHLMAAYRAGELNAEDVAAEMAITPRRVRQLYRDYLLACTRTGEATWSPGTSGGNRRKTFPAEVLALWRAMLRTRPPASYSFAASEAQRRYGVHADRATVRRWALENGLSLASPSRRRVRPVRRWQCQQIGALWQMDASPHRWLGPETSPCPMIEILDDCSRVIVAARLYAREILLAYYDLLPRAFQTYGLPLALYVDYHSFFFSSVPDALTDLGWALQFYGVTFRYAPTPQAKGKIERLHQYWQNRLPSFFALERPAHLNQANEQLDELRRHHNRQEIHRELGVAPETAWSRALAEHRSRLRPAPACPWWPYIWSQRVLVRVGADGMIPCGTHRIKLAGAYRLPGTRVMHCTHPDGAITLLGNTKPVGRPVILYRWEPSPSKKESSSHTKRKV